MAKVAILRFTSVIKFSRSRLQLVTDAGCVMATLFNVRTAANLSVGLGELRNSCKTGKKWISGFSISINVLCHWSNDVLNVKFKAYVQNFGKNKMIGFAMCASATQSGVNISISILFRLTTSTRAHTTTSILFELKPNDFTH